MDGVAEAGLLDQGHDAAATGDWSRAFDLLVQADQDTRLSVDDLGLLAEVAYAAGHLDVTIVAWERTCSRVRFMYLHSIVYMIKFQLACRVKKMRNTRIVPSNCC